MYLHWLPLLSNLLVMSDKFLKLSLIFTFSESTSCVIVCREDAMLFCLSEIPCTSRCNAEHALWPFVTSLISAVICLSSVATLFSSDCLCSISLASMLFKIVVFLEDEDSVGTVVVSNLDLGGPWCVVIVYAGGNWRDSIVTLTRDKLLTQLFHVFQNPWPHGNP